METGAGFPDHSISILRMRNAGLPRQEKSRVTASSHKCLKFEGAAASTRRVLGSRGGSGRQNALVSEEALGHSERSDDLEARGVQKSENEG